MGAARPPLPRARARASACEGAHAHIEHDLAEPRTRRGHDTRGHKLGQHAREDLLQPRVQRGLGRARAEVVHGPVNHRARAAVGNPKPTGRPLVPARKRIGACARRADKNTNATTPVCVVKRSKQAHSCRGCTPVQPEMPYAYARSAARELQAARRRTRREAATRARRPPQRPRGWCAT